MATAASTTHTPTSLLLNQQNIDAIASLLGSAPSSWQLQAAETVAIDAAERLLFYDVAVKGITATASNTEEGDGSNLSSVTPLSHSPPCCYYIVHATPSTTKEGLPPAMVAKLPPKVIFVLVMDAETVVDGATLAAMEKLCRGGVVFDEVEKGTSVEGSTAPPHAATTAPLPTPTPPPPATQYLLAMVDIGGNITYAKMRALQA